MGLKLTKINSNSSKFIQIDENLVPNSSKWIEIDQNLIKLS